MNNQINESILKNINQETQIKKLGRGKKFVILISGISVFFIVLYALMRIFVFDFFIVSGLGMKPIFERNDWVLLKTYDKNYNRGEIVAFKDPQFNENSFKRIVGLPGEEVKIAGNFVWINNQRLDEYCYLPFDAETLRDTELTLKENEYFVLGDNRKVSIDSRVFGAITKESIIGKYWLSLFNFKNENKLIDKCAFLSFVTPEKQCADNGGKFEARNGAPYCFFDGAECGEFGYNMCVASKGKWQPASENAPQGTDMAIYRNEKYGFEFRFPALWKRVADADSIEGTGTIVTVIYPTSYPAQDFSAHISVYQSNLTTTKKDNRLFRDKSSSVVVRNGIPWTKIQMIDFFGKPIDSFGYLTEMYGKTYNVGGTGDLTDQILSGFKFTNLISKFCTDPLIPMEIGYGKHPVDPKYGELNWLGQIFTAYDCGSERLDAIFGVDKGIFGIGLHINLKNNPSQQLINIFNALGFDCADNNSAERCKIWEIKKPIKIDDLMKLKPYYDNFQRDDCVECG